MKPESGAPRPIDAMMNLVKDEALSRHVTEHIDHVERIDRAIEEQRSEKVTKNLAEALKTLVRVQGTLEFAQKAKNANPDSLISRKSVEMLAPILKRIETFVQVSDDRSQKEAGHPNNTSEEAGYTAQLTGKMVRLARELGMAVDLEKTLTGYDRRIAEAENLLKDEAVGKPEPKRDAYYNARYLTKDGNAVVEVWKTESRELHADLQQMGITTMEQLAKYLPEAVPGGRME